MESMGLINILGGAMPRIISLIMPPPTAVTSPRRTTPKMSTPLLIPVPDPEMANAMVPNGEYRFYTCAKDYSFIDKYAFDDEALLISGNGANVGYIHYYKGKFNAYQRTYVISDFVDNVFCLKYFLDYYLKKRIQEEVNSGNTPYIKKNTITDMLVDMPTKELEQQLIAEYLSDIDILIENLEKLIVKKKNIKLGTMQELLTGKKRLAGFTKEWEEKSLGELGVFTGGGVDKKLVTGQKSVTLLNFLDVYHKDFIYKKQLHHVVTASDAQIRKCTLKKGDVFFTPSSEMRTDLAMSAVVMEDCPGYVYSYHITRFRFNDEFDIKFKSYVFNSKYFLDQASLICEGSGKRYVVNLSKFKNLTIKYPTDIKEQSAISEILWDIDQEIQDLEQQLNKYKLLKQGMMEQLLTGKIRLV